MLNERVIQQPPNCNGSARYPIQGRETRIGTTLDTQRVSPQQTNRASVWIISRHLRYWLGSFNQGYALMRLGASFPHQQLIQDSVATGICKARRAPSVIGDLPTLGSWLHTASPHRFIPALFVGPMTPTPISQPHQCRQTLARHGNSSPIRQPSQ